MTRHDFEHKNHRMLRERERPAYGESVNNFLAERSVGQVRKRRVTRLALVRIDARALREPNGCAEEQA